MILFFFFLFFSVNGVVLRPIAFGTTPVLPVA